jgi:hypothetical protein
MPQRIEGHIARVEPSRLRSLAKEQSMILPPPRLAIPPRKQHGIGRPLCGGVPQTKAAEVLTWKGVVFVSVAFSAVFG